jgi:hypothetical protein
MDSTVEVAKAFRKFIFLVLICFLSGAIFSRAIQKVLDEKWLVFSRSLQEKKIQASRPQIIFSRAGIPTLGARIETVSYETQSHCLNYKVTAQELFLPLKISKLILLRLEFGTLRVAQTRLEFHESAGCTTEELAEKTATIDGFEDVVAKVDPSPQDKSEVSVSPKWIEQLSSWFTTHQARLSRMPIRHFRLDSLEVEGETLKEKKLKGSGSIAIDLTEELRADVVFEQLVLGKTTRSVATEFKASLTASKSEIRFLGDWAYYEGHLIADFKFDPSQKVELSIKSKDLPLSVLNRWFDTPWTFQFLWFNCGFELKALKKDWAQSPWSLQNCQITGPHGEIEFLSERTTSLEKFDHLQARVINLQLDRIFKGKEQLPFSGILKDYGTLNSTVTVRGDLIESQWSVRQPSFVFSRQNKRLLQSLDLLSGSFDYKKSLYSLKVEKAEIQNGLFKGLLSLDYDKKQKNLKGSVDVRQISLAPEIQQLMIGGLLAPVQVTGQVTIQDVSKDRRDKDQPVATVGQIRFESAKYKNSFMEAKNLSVLVGWTHQGPQMAWAAQQLDLDKSDETRWLFASLLQESKNRTQLNLQQVYIKGSPQEKRRFVVEKSTAYALSLGRFSLQGQLQWVDGQGTAQWKLFSGDSLDWEWSYRPQDSTWIPQNKDMREWLTNNESFTAEYPFIR